MKMPITLKQKWLEALRSGEYKRTSGVLANEDGYCCLGVLECVAEQAIELHKYDPSRSASYPSLAFFERHGIIDEIYKDGMPVSRHLAELNDSGVIFSDIANVIEREVEGV